MKNLIIVGAGGFAKEIYGYIKNDIKKGLLKDIVIKGFLVDFLDDHKKLNVDEPYLGKIRDYASFANDFLIVAIGENPGREKIVNMLEDKRVQFYTYIHSSACIDFSARIGKGVIICPNAMVNANALVSDFSVLNIYSSIAHDVVIGQNSILSPYATLNGCVEAGKNLFMGTRSTILPKIKVGDNCTISAGTIVSKAMKNNTLAFPKNRTLYKESL